MQDLGSTNGGFVNGQRLTGEPRSLVAGDLVRCGSCILAVTHDVASMQETLPEEARALGWVSSDNCVGSQALGRASSLRIALRLARLRENES